MANEQGAHGQQDPKQALIRKLSQQAADLVNKAGLPAATVATLYLDVCIALMLHLGTPPRDVAAALKLHAERLEAPDTEDPFSGEMPRA